jgi:hypothetical protein
LFRSVLTLSAAPSGLVVGSFTWLVLAHGAPDASRIAELQSRAIALAAPLRENVDEPAGALAIASPLFTLTTGPGAVAETDISLTGLERTPAHTAALVSINGKPPAWLEVGETRDDVTLTEVQPDKIVVDTPTGLKEIALGQRPQTAAGAGQMAPNPASPPPGQSPPSGFRLPPPPASAPRG